MPKSISTLQSQISACENNIQQAFSECVIVAGGQDVSFSWSLKVFINNIATCDIEETSTSITKAIHLFQKCEKIAALEKKRRAYVGQLQKVLEAREQKETVKRLTRRIQFKKKVKLTIPSPPSSQELEELEELK